MISLNQIGEDGPSLLDWLQEFIDTDTLHNRGEEAPARFRRRAPIERKIAPSYTLFGQIDAGESGLPADLVNDKTAKLRAKRLVDDAELIPYYFQVHCPKDTKVATLIMQRIGQRGPYVFFQQNLVRAFRDAFPDHRLELEPFISGRGALTIE